MAQNATKCVQNTTILPQPLYKRPSFICSATSFSVSLKVITGNPEGPWTVTEQTLDQFFAHLDAGQMPVYEYIASGQQVPRAYFDYDCFVLAEPSLEAFEAMRDRAIAHIIAALDKGTVNVRIEAKDIAFGYCFRRIPRSPKDGPKTKHLGELKASFHFVVPSVSMRGIDILAIVKHAVMPPEFDRSVYTNGQRKFGCIGSFKASYDRAILEPKTDHPRSDCIVQYLDGKETLAQLVDGLDIASTEPKSKAKQATTSAIPPRSPGNAQELSRDVKTIGVLMDCYTIERADAYSSWLNFGIGLKNIADRGAPNEALTLWHAFSKKSSRYNEDECNAKWTDDLPPGKTHINIGSFIVWAREDDPAKCALVRAHPDICDPFRLSLSGLESDMATYMHSQYAGLFACPDPTRWYCFDRREHRWIEDTSREFRLHLLEACPQYASLAAAEAEVATRCENEAEAKRHKGVAKAAATVQMLLKQTCFKDKVLKELNTLFKVPINWADGLDTDPYLIGFPNGVYDLRTATFRDGLPTDMIASKWGCPYTPDVDLGVRERILAFLREVTVVHGDDKASDAMFQYKLDIMGYMLDGHKSKEFFLIWTGPGGNGKGVESMLIIKTFGDYGYAPNASVFTIAKTSAGQANSELAKAKGKLIVIASEPPAEQQIQVALMKELTGGDMVQARKLYGNAMEFVPKFLIIIQCNILPKLSGYDGGIVRRIYNVHYGTRFVEDPVLPNQRKRDETLKRLFESKEYRQQFTLLCLERYALNQLREFTVPEYVKEFTKKYVDDNNLVGQFIEQHLEVTGDPSDLMSASEMMEHFKGTDLYHAKDKTWLKDQLSVNGMNSKKCNRRNAYRNMWVYEGVKPVYVVGITAEDDSDDGLDN